MRRLTLPWWVAAALLLGGLLWGQCQHAAGAADARLNDSTAVQRARNDSLRRANTALLALRHRDSAQVARLAGERDSLARVAQTRRSRATVTAQALRPALPDTLRPIFDSVVTDFQSAIADLARSLARADSILTLRERELGAVRAQNAQLVTALARTEGLMDGWRRQAHPGLFTQLRRGLPYVAAGVLVGVLIAQ